MSRPTPVSVDALVRATARHNALRYAELLVTGDLRHAPDLAGWSLQDADDQYVGWVKENEHGIRLLRRPRAAALVAATWSDVLEVLEARVGHGDRDSITAAWIHHSQVQHAYLEAVQTEQEMTCGWPRRRPVPAGLTAQQVQTRVVELRRERYLHGTQVLAPLVDLAVNRTVDALDLLHA